MEPLVVATHNAGKLTEIRAILADFPFDVRGLAEFNIEGAEETGASFVENALLKARHAAKSCNSIALADDSGLVVDALNGQPGIYSARYAGPNATDTDNIAALLHALKDVPEGQRSARFICVLCYMRHADDPDPLICRGVWEGEILTSADGQGGFGYDPIFFVRQENQTAAQMSPITKNFSSHRGQALRQLLQLLGQ